MGSTEGSARAWSDPVPPRATGPELSSVSLTTDPYATGSEGFFPRPPQTPCSLGVASSSHSGGLLPSFLLGRPKSPNLPSSGALGRTARQRGAPPAQCWGDRPGGPVEPPVGRGVWSHPRRLTRPPGSQLPASQDARALGLFSHLLSGRSHYNDPRGSRNSSPSRGPPLAPGSCLSRSPAGAEAGRAGPERPARSWGGARPGAPGVPNLTVSGDSTQAQHAACPPLPQYQQRPRHRDALKTASTVPTRPAEARTAETRRNQKRTGPAGPQHLDRLSVPDLVLQTSGSSVSRQCPGA